MRIVRFTRAYPFEFSAGANPRRVPIDLPENVTIKELVLEISRPGWEVILDFDGKPGNIVPIRCETISGILAVPISAKRIVLTFHPPAGATGRVHGLLGVCGTEASPQELHVSQNPNTHFQSH